MNHARKLIAFVRDCALRVSGQLEHPECTPADLIDARRTIAHMRADLDECDQRIRAQIERSIHRKDPFVPAVTCTMREVDAYERRLTAGGAASGLPATIHEHVSVAATIESPNREALNYTPGPRFPRGRYTFDHQARRLIAMSGTISAPGRKAS
jgi:hypothetical protein